MDEGRAEDRRQKRLGRPESVSVEMGGDPWSGGRNQVWISLCRVGDARTGTLSP